MVISVFCCFAYADEDIPEEPAEAADTVDLEPLTVGESAPDETGEPMLTTVTAPAPEDGEEPVDAAAPVTALDDGEEADDAADPVTAPVPNGDEELENGAVLGTGADNAAEDGNGSTVIWIIVGAVVVAAAVVFVVLKKKK